MPPISDIRSYKIIRREPWFLPLLRRAFPCDFEKNVFTWGTRIYTKYALSEPLFSHEKTHCKQQQFSYFWGMVWWVWYVLDERFRLEQELEAYREQYRKFCEQYADREQRTRYARELSEALSGPLYKHIMTFETAFAKITQ